MKIQNGFSLKPTDPQTKAAQQDAQLREAAKMYESHFLNQLVKSMRQTIHRDEGFIQPNFAEKIFSEQLDNQYVDAWSEKGGVGLADMIYSQIKDQYLNTTHRQMQNLKNQVLPLNPKKELNGLKPTESIQIKKLPVEKPAQLGYRFEVMGPAGGEFEAQAPMPGKVASVSGLADGWNSLRLDHGDGLYSEMTFPGRSATIGVGDEVQAGQKLGVLDPTRPVLAWNLDWT